MSSPHRPARVGPIAAAALGVALVMVALSCLPTVDVETLKFVCDPDAGTEPCGRSFICYNGFCERVGDGGCITHSPEVCDDHFDNNCDGLTDCQDAVCNALTCGPNGMVCTSLACVCSGNGTPPEFAEQSCPDGIDNDCDGLVDCADPDCDVKPCDGFGRTCVRLGCVGYARSTSPQAFVDACAQAGFSRYLLQADGGEVDDGVTGIQPLPFAFSFFGSPMTTYWLNSNGTMSFSDTTSPAHFFACPSAGPLTLQSRPAIFALRDDLKTTGLNGVCVATTGAAPNRSLIATWKNAVDYYDGGTRSFSVFLRETTNVVDIIFGTMSGDGGVDALVGLQAGTDAGSSPSLYLEHACGATQLPSGTALRFTP